MRKYVAALVNKESMNKLTLKMYLSGFSFSLGPGRTSKMELLVKNSLAAVSCYLYMLKELHSRWSTGLKIRFWLTEILKPEFLEKSNTTDTDSSALHFD